MGSKKCRNMMFSTQIDKVSYKDAQVTYDYFMNYLTKKPAQIAVILHDKDTDEEGNIIKPHLHVMMRFDNARSIDKVAEELLQPAQTIEAWNDNYNNGFSYLIHETASAENKYKYDPKEVVANFNFNKKIIEIRALAKSNFKENDLSGKIINSLIDEIKEGTKTKEEVEAVVPGSKLARYKVAIDAAYNHLRRNEQQKWRDNMISTNQQIYTLYFYGEAGTGKTRNAKDFAKTFSDSVYITGSSNDPFQNYSGETTIIIDELRHNTFVYSDLLKILDPYNFDAMASSRYHDKYLMADTIIITSPYSPNDLYNLIKKNDRNMDPRIDSFRQFARRLSSVKHFTMSYLEYAFYNEKYDKFICYKDSREPNEYSNPVNKTEIKKKKEFENEYEIYYESIKTRGHAINE